MGKSLFIVIDGLDGSGKSEIVKMLHNYLFSKSKKYRILTTREPTNGTYGTKIRKILGEEKDPDVNAENLLELFTKDRDEHLKNVILPFLEKSNEHELNIVLCDRYYYSTIAFQCTQGLDVRKVIEKNEKFRKPDIALIMDIEPEIALDRIKYREKEKFEQIGFMKKLRKNFLKLPSLLSDNIKIVDASKSLHEVFEEIKKEVDKLL
ncbi:MAG TPA: dTMP kinase [Candidatus Nanoarchaeia archaeon]|nr:dTMP kinase [Candidatus Woesearchaeota archaeon]HLF53827.1 dTMP kinase [Candidatus Nanoarchaeia archaeon]